MGWAFRAADDNDIVIYDIPERFSIQLYHGGELTDTDYKGGNITWVDNCDKDLMLLTDIDDMAEKLGYGGSVILYHYKIPRVEFEKGLKCLECDKDVVHMSNFVGKDCSIINLYFEHLTPDENLLRHKSYVDKVIGGEQGDQTVAAGDAICDQTVAISAEQAPQTYLIGEAAPNEVADFFDEDYGLDDDHPTFRRFVDEQCEIDDNAREEEGNARTTQGGTTKDIPSSSRILEDLNLEVLDDVEKGYNTEELESVHGSDDEDVQHRRYPEFNPATDMADPQFVIGLIFKDAKVFRAAVREYSIKNGFAKIRFTRNELFKLHVKCIKGCPWKMRVGKMYKHSSLQIKKLYNHHVCGRMHDNRNVFCRWIAEKYIERIKQNPTWPVDSFIQTVESEWNVKVSKIKGYRALQHAKKIIEGSHAEQYRRLRDYCEEIKRTNPGSTCKIMLDEGKFLRLYMCLGACKEGFIRGCRPLVGLDGCHLKGPFGGQLLSAIGVDGNEETWVIAYACVEIENKDSWSWFLDLLADDIGIVNTNGWTFISDQQKGLIPALQDVLPNAHHRFCVRHLYTNFNALYKGKALKDALWNCARATTPIFFKKAMDDVKKLDDGAYNWLMARPAEHWSRSHFSTFSKCDMLLNNLCESFNSVILKARSKPILTMLEMIRTMLMKRIQVRRDKMMNYVGGICPKIKKKVEDNKVGSSSCVATWNGGDRYQVGAGGTFQYIVDLKAHTCSCRRFDLTGIPCIHAVAAMKFMLLKPEDYVDPFYTKARYLEAYQCLINPVNGSGLWEVTNNVKISSPQYNRQPGRPRMKRKKSANEQTSNLSDLTNLGRQEQATVKCGHCNNTGHNARTCHRYRPPRERPAPSTYVPTRERKNKRSKATRTSQDTRASQATSASQEISSSQISISFDPPPATQPSQ